MYSDDVLDEDVLGSVRLYNSGVEAESFQYDKS